MGPNVYVFGCFASIFIYRIAMGAARVRIPTYFSYYSNFHQNSMESETEIDPRLITDVRC